MPTDATTISYTLRRIPRARHVRITVRRGGSVVVTAPVRATVKDIERAIGEHESWIRRIVAAAQARQAHLPSDLVATSYVHYLRFKERARALAHRKVKQWNAQYGFAIHRIAVKNHSSRWGSCSHHGNLNFNYKLLFLPEFLVDYVVVHELCHLKELNHSPNFWALMSRSLPDWQQRRAHLQQL